MDREPLRRSFLPAQVAILLIGESPPASGKFFYLGGPMATYTSRAFEGACSIRFACTSEFFRFFKTRGCYLDDLSLLPVDRLSPTSRAKALSDSIPALGRRLREHQPEVVVVVLKRIERHVREALALAGLRVPTYILPFPGNGHQAEYVSGLSKVLGKHLPPEPA